MKKLNISPEELKDCQSWTTDDKGAIRYWLLTGLPDGIKLSDYYSEEFIERVKAELNLLINVKDK